MQKPWKPILPRRRAWSWGKRLLRTAFRGRISKSGHTWCHLQFWVLNSKLMKTLKKSCPPPTYHHGTSIINLILQNWFVCWVCLCFVVNTLNKDSVPSLVVQNTLFGMNHKNRKNVKLNRRSTLNEFHHDLAFHQDHKETKRGKLSKFESKDARCNLVFSPSSMIFNF